MKPGAQIAYLIAQTNQISTVVALFKQASQLDISPQQARSILEAYRRFNERTIGHAQMSHTLDNLHEFKKVKSQLDLIAQEE